MNRVLPSRRGLLCQPGLALLPVLFGLPLVAGALFSSLSSSPQSDPLLCQVTRAPFVHEVSVQGEVESAVNVEVRCDVRCRNSWIRILEVVPEGTRVKPGDFLIRLDSSSLETERLYQQGLCEESRAMLAAARSRYETARKAKRDYLQGEYRLARREAEVAVLLAAEKARKAREFYEASQQLKLKGYITAQQLQADEYNWRAAEKDLATAQLKLSFLEKYTKRRKLEQIEGQLVISKAKLAAAENLHNLHQKTLAEIDEEIQKCVIRAPVAGDVVLAHLHHFGHSHMVEPGEMTYRHRVLVRLPDPARMQIIAKIEEDKIAFVRAGQPVTIILEAFPDVELPGQVLRVDDFPKSEEWYDAGVRKYVAVVRIDGTLEGLRPHLTATVKIRVQELDDQLQLPCQAVFKHADKTYCIRPGPHRLEAQEISVGPANGKTIVIRSGLQEGDRVVLAAAAHRDEVLLPEARNGTEP